MRALKTVEEIRAKARERQARWRNKNKVLSRERKAYVYGKAKYPQMVEDRMRPETRARYGVPDKAPIINNVTTPPEPPQEEEEWGEWNPGEDPVYVEEDPADGRTQVEKRQQQEQAHYLAKRLGKKELKREVAGADQPSTENDRCLQWLARKAKERVVKEEGGRGVVVELEGI